MAGAYRVYFRTPVEGMQIPPSGEVETWIEVEASSKDEAIRLAKEELHEDFPLSLATNIRVQFVY